jgi:hypothetical protein
LTTLVYAVFSTSVYVFLQVASANMNFLLGLIISHSIVKCNQSRVSPVAAVERRPEVKILSVSFNPSRIRSDDDLFPSSIFVGESSTKDSEAPSYSPSEEREVNTGSDNVDFVPNFGITEADEEETDFSNPFAGMSEVSNFGLLLIKNWLLL